MAQLIDISRISTAANAINFANDNINNSFNSVRSGMQQLSNSWHGPAGTAVQSMIQELFNFSDRRSQVVDNFFRILTQQIDPVYQVTETGNKSLADNFK